MAELRFNDVVSTVINLFPQLTEVEQRLSLELYRLLAKGQPVTREALAAKTGLPVAQVDAVLGDWYGVFYDKAGRIIGYWGLSLSEMKHRFRVNGSSLYAWCAWDTLFIPQILGCSAEVESICPVTHETIWLIVSPNGVVALDSQPPSVSFVTPEQAKIKEDVVMNFCHAVYFFRSADAGERWVLAHPGTFLLTLDQAWKLGGEKNAAQYSQMLDIIESKP